MIMRYGVNAINKHSLKNVVRCVLIVFSLLLTSYYLIKFPIGYNWVRKVHPKNMVTGRIKTMPKVIVSSRFPPSAERNPRCSYYTCFNPYRCGRNGQQRIQVYVYPFKFYVNENGVPVIRHLSNEYYRIVQTITNSRYYTSEPEQACVFVVPFDTLSQYNFDINDTSRALNLLPYWKNGENHLLFNFMSAKHATVLKLNTGNAIIAGAGFDTWTYRRSFDVSLPPYVPITHVRKNSLKRIWLITSFQLNIHSTFQEKLQKLSRINPELIICHRCENFNLSYRCCNENRFDYPEVLQNSVFCIIFRGTRLSQPVLLEALAFGCIPIILSDTLVMPFEEILDWKRAAFFVLENDLNSVVEIAKCVSNDTIEEMSNHGSWLYSKYFNSVESITNITLDILNERVFPENTLFYEDWNLKHTAMGARSPLFLRTKSLSQSFTAVVLAYDRVESLFTLVEKLASISSLSMILVVWNNQKKSPPESSKWPRISKTLKVIRTTENKLSNRFIPYDEIQTEAVLSIDDDISMLTDDELDFGFEVWREFPDRIVGFPSRTHVWDNMTKTWRYESEWTNEVSIILTGAAFYHKFWNYLYTTYMPVEVKNWVDSNMNCEDIAMNFLVANFTNKAPIKVTPRKKFKCPECTSTEMLSADLRYMLARSKCINKFSEIFGRVPLKTVEFRADPVLYKDNFPPKLKRFKNIGNL